MTSRPDGTPRGTTKRPAEPDRPEPGSGGAVSLLSLRIGRRRWKAQPSDDGLA